MSSTIKTGENVKYRELERLIEVIETLRDPNGGCPWDLKQDHKSLLKYLIEESYEFLDAVESNDDFKMKDELGDVLLQVILHSVIARQRGSFNIEDVASNLSEKLIRRHPHVFNVEDKTLSPDQVKANWDIIKKTEKKDKLESEKSLIDQSFLSFPSLFAANRIGEKTHTIKFDWDNWQQVREVVESEWVELKVELDDPNLKKDKVEEEIGDLLFSVAQLARHLKVHPEDALRAANRKFIRRFHKMEAMIKKDGIALTDLNQKEMDVYWNKVKEIERDLTQNE